MNLEHNKQKFTVIPVSGISAWNPSGPHKDIIQSDARIDSSFNVFIRFLSKFPYSHPLVKSLIDEINNCVDVQSILWSLGCDGVIFKNGKWYGRKKYSSYNDYLESDLWKMIRDIILERDCYSCQACHSKATQVHHKSYPYQWGLETNEMLVSVCDSCHHQFHRLQKAMT